MGQKANPNSFHKNFISNNQNFSINTFVNSTEYTNLLKHNLYLSSNFLNLFNKNLFFVKNCFFLTNSKKYSILLFLSFFFIYNKKAKLKAKQELKKKIKIYKKISTFIVQKFFNIFLKMGYFF